MIIEIEQAFIVAANMQRYGGTFEQRLGAALEHADICNLQKIHDAFPELWHKFLNWGNNK